ncbi:MAG: PD-(D/E)XK nuclease family protein [Candidatus Yanofskybacteria bacterium]|nr:PD-(D/E)XK nuclease family protein [Candidatus Yanofskybacteria bacterium]
MNLFRKITKLFHNEAEGPKDENIDIGTEKAADCCPYCKSKKFVKKGSRKKKLEIVQLYKCSLCLKVFTAQLVKGNRFPTNTIIDALSYYNLGFGLEDTSRILNKKFGVKPDPATISRWVRQYSQLCRYDRLRSFAVKMCRPEDTIEVMNMAHRQIYRFLYHRPKMQLTLKEFKNRNFEPLKDYLDGVSGETPHQYFQEGARMSEIKTKFDKSQMIVRSKSNYANRLADFVLQTVKDRKKRHEILQQFFVANDSVTVASEVPVYIRKEDVEHMENVLKFQITNGESIELSGRKGQEKNQPFPKLLTGHIDLLQVRNGQIHILDYKPNAAKEKPLEQLTWYALALSRLTGLRLFEFKCAWFDEKDKTILNFFRCMWSRKFRTKKEIKKFT